MKCDTEYFGVERKTYHFGKFDIERALRETFGIEMANVCEFDIGHDDDGHIIATMVTEREAEDRPVKIIHETVRHF